jgi:uncharacterized membrane protein
MLCMLASAGGILALGVMHLVYTFCGSKLTPRDASLQASMRVVSPVITRQTTIWKCWVGFNASHSMGAMLFGLVYGYLALLQPAMLFQSAFLLALGLVTLAGYVVLGKRYWFSVPFNGICLSLGFYVVAIALSRLQL